MPCASRVSACWRRAARCGGGFALGLGCVRLWTGFQSSMARPCVGRKDKRYQREAIMVRASLFAAALVSMLATPLGAQTADFKPVTREMLANPSPDDWLMLNRTYDEQRFSPLKEINRDTVVGLQLAWARGMAAGTNETIPIVYQGVMYVVSPGAGVLALDATNGDLIWDYSREYPKEMTDFIGAPTAARQKGLAIFEDMIFFESADWWRSTRAPARSAGRPRSRITRSSPSTRRRRSWSRAKSSPAAPARRAPAAS